MSNGCPRKAEWLDLLDGEATENRASVLRAHAAECPACGRELALQRQLIADLAAPVPVAAGAVEAIMRQLPQARPAPPRRRHIAIVGSVALAAAAVLLLIPWGGKDAKDPGTFIARGDKVPWTQKVGAEVFVLGNTLTKLRPGTRVAPGMALVASYHNVDRARAYLMVVALDARGEWHWLYPGFEDAKSDPTSVSMEPLQTRRVLPDSVVLDDLPPGALELIMLISRQPLRVSRLESLPTAERDLPALRARFADVHITGVSLQVLAAPAAQEKP